VALATVEEFEERHGVLDFGERGAVTAHLNDATDLILDVASQEWTQETAPRRIKSICLSVAYRAWSNPDALSQSSMGDVALSYTRGGIADAVFLTKLELAAISRASGQSGFVAATLVSPYSEGSDPLDGWA
jgi:hypothetical protein